MNYQKREWGSLIILLLFLWTKICRSQDCTNVPIEVFPSGAASGCKWVFFGQCTRSGNIMAVYQDYSLNRCYKICQETIGCQSIAYNSEVNYGQCTVLDSRGDLLASSDATELYDFACKFCILYVRGF